MSKRTLATIGGVIAATLLVAGIAWASGSDDSVTSTTSPGTSTSLDDNGSSTSVGESTSTSLQGQTSTTLDDNTSSTIDDDDVTGTTIDDDDQNDDRGKDDEDDDDNEGRGGDDDDAVPVSDGAHTYQVPGAGSVTINVSGGALELAEVQVNAGWTFEVDKAQADRIKVKFRNGESEAEFEAELEHGGISIDIEQGD
jgi:hypothetical protein